VIYRFLLVSLNIDAILGEVTISSRRQKLKEMTKGNHLGDAYTTTLDRMRAQKGSRSRLGMEALMWVSNSERPLHTSELCHALGVKIGSTDLDLENVPEIRTILGCSLGLIVVEAQCSEPSGGPTGTAGIMPRRRDGTGPLTVVLGRSSYSGDGRARLGPPGPTR